MKLRLVPLAALCGWLAVAPPNGAQAQTPSLQQQEMEHLAEYRRNADPYALANLAETREEMGQYIAAADNWNWLLKKHASQESLAYAVSPTDKVRPMLYGELAQWKLKRLERRRNLQSRPVSAAQKSAALQAELRFDRTPPVKYVRSTRNIDIDGDGIDEIVVEGKATEWPSSKMTSIGIYKWDGQSTYRPIWRAKAMPVEVIFGDHDGKGNPNGKEFPVVTMIYTRNSDDVASLEFNGTSFMAYSSV